MNILRITGIYWTGDKTPESTIADMLRYDDGEMADWRGFDIPGMKAYRKFVAEVHSNDFTPERWRRFNLKAELVNKEKGKASCSYPDAARVEKAIHEHR
jgi:hypothetical protein